MCLLSEQLEEPVMSLKNFIWIAAGLVMTFTANAQDTRTVTEPVIPPVCAILKADLTATKGLDPADEAKLDTVRLQKGIEDCAEGKALELSSDGARNAFLSGPIVLKTGVTLLIDGGVTLYGSRNPGDYETAPGSCGIISDAKSGCRPLIYGKHAMDAAIMGDGTIDGRGGSRLIVDGKEQSKTWWDLAEDARAGGHQQNPRLIILDGCNNFTLYRVTLKNAAFFHVTYSNGDGFTVWGLKIDTPKTARNTDGVDPGSSKNITVTQSYIRTGDDNIAIKGGSGPVTNMTVIHNHFYYGHGMSIGSETTAGVSALRVTDLSLDGTDAGIRIKSQQAYGGLVHDAVYDNLCIRNSKAPIQLDTNYSANPKPGTGKIPVFTDIVLRNVRIQGGGKIQLNGFDATHRIGIQFDGVTLDSPSAYKFAIDHADIMVGPGPVNFQMSGADSTLRGTAGKGTLASCSAMFVPFPAQ
jgi:polygalacturonase